MIELPPKLIKQIGHCPVKNCETLIVSRAHPPRVVDAQRRAISDGSITVE
jgi:hypothetical protein